MIVVRVLIERDERICLIPSVQNFSRTEMNLKNRAPPEIVEGIVM